MPRITLLTRREPEFLSLSKQLDQSPNIHVDWAASADDIDLAFGKAPDLLIIDREVGGHAALVIARQVIGVNAMVNLAVVSDLSDEDFHEASEGLGIMARLSDPPGAEDAVRLLDLLGQMPG